MTMRFNYQTVVQHLFIYMLFIFSVTTVHAEIIQGKVVSITDGDTLILLTPSNQQVKTGLAGIDTPEKKQPFGNKAKQALAALTFQKQVTVDVQTIDRFSRTVGRVYVHGFDVNAELVKQGLAWVYRKYTKDQKLYQLEDEAKKYKRGLWSSDKPIAPWDWRKGKRTVEHNPSYVRGMIIANKNSHIYHLSNCPSYYKVAERNRVLFTNETLAKANGYQKASNCK